MSLIVVMFLSMLGGEVHGEYIFDVSSVGGVFIHFGGRGS
jgi:hypothetical protein